MAALEDVAVGGHRQLAVEHPLRLVGIELEEAVAQLDVRVVEVVAAHLVLGLGEDLAVGHRVVVLDLREVAHALQGHEDALESVGDLDGDRVEDEAARLLEVGELGDLEPVEPHLPAEAPRTERRRGPVVLDEADVVRPGVDPEGLETLEVDLLGVLRRRLEDHLVLRVRLQAVGVLAVPGVVGRTLGST